MDNHRATEPASAPIGHQGAETISPPKPKPPVPKIDVNAVLFRAACECRSYEGVGYYLNGVYVQPHPGKGVLLVATDGHRLVCIHDETGSCDIAAIVEVEPCALAGIKLDRKKPDEIPRLRLDAEGHVIVGTYRSIKPAPIDGTYPDYRLILKPIVEAVKKGVFSPASFNHEYIASFSKVSALVNGDSKAVRIVTTNESDPALVLFERAPHVFGVLMPIRSSIQNGMPAFMRPVLEPKLEPAPPPTPITTAAPKKKVARKKVKKAVKTKRGRRK